MNTATAHTGIAVDHTVGADTRRTTAGKFLDTLARRDFPGLESCLDPNVRFRALVPRGALEENGAAPAVALLRRWFGADDSFEVLDAAIGQAGPRIYLRWQVRTGVTGNSDFGAGTFAIRLTGTVDLDSLTRPVSGVGLPGHTIRPLPAIPRQPRSLTDRT